MNDKTVRSKYVVLKSSGIIGKSIPVVLTHLGDP